MIPYQEVILVLLGIFGLFFVAYRMTLTQEEAEEELFHHTAQYLRKEFGMDFGEAIREMKKGHRVARLNWNGPDQWIAIQQPDENSKMKKPYIYISPVDDELVPWLASQTDMLCEDWYVVA